VFPGDMQATLDAIRQNPSKIKELPYTTAVIKESMRLRPPGLSATVAPNGQVPLICMTLFLYCKHLDVEKKLTGKSVHRHTISYLGAEHSLDGLFVSSVTRVLFMNTISLPYLIFFSHPSAVHQSLPPPIQRQLCLLSTCFRPFTMAAAPVSRSCGFVAAVPARPA
jgi:hypothetical protein